MSRVYHVRSFCTFLKVSLATSGAKVFLSSLLSLFYSPLQGFYSISTLFLKHKIVNLDLPFWQTKEIIKWTITGNYHEPLDAWIIYLNTQFLKLGSNTQKKI